MFKFWSGKNSNKSYTIEAPEEGEDINIEEEKNKTLAIINNFTEGFLLFDKKNKLSLINPQAESFFGVESGSIIGSSFFELNSVYPLVPVLEVLGAELRSVFRKEVQIRENLTLEVSTTPILTEGVRIGTLVILHDITREKVVERMKSEFVSITAHQLRTPLAAIKWTLKMLLDGDLGKINEDQRNFIEKTYTSNERMIILINDLLNVTRIEEGRIIYKPVLADIEPIIQSVIDIFQEEIRRRRIMFEFKKSETPPPKIMLDVEKIKLAIQNLIDNAIRYTLVGGRVTVSINHDNKEIEVSIQDTGVGIPKSQQERVFSKFFRGGNVIRMETQGTGLGLFITKNIIEAHGGEIWFESEEGRGTTFHFTLPIKKGFAEYLTRKFY